MDAPYEQPDDPQEPSNAESGERHPPFPDESEPDGRPPSGGFPGSAPPFGSPPQQQVEDVDDTDDIEQYKQGTSG